MGSVHPAADGHPITPIYRAGFVSLLVLSIALPAHAQHWQQWGQNPRHTGAVTVPAQKLNQILGNFTYDGLADQIRGSGDLLVHYMAPLVDGNDVFTMSRGDSTWLSLYHQPRPLRNAALEPNDVGVTRLNAGAAGLSKVWTALSSWKPVPDDGSGWEPVFHPALSGNFIYVPGAAGSLMKFDRQSGALLEELQPFGETDPNRYVVSPVTVAADGSLYYTVVKLDAVTPWESDAQEAWLVKFDASGRARKLSFADLVPQAPRQGCVTTFAGMQLPWPPALDAIPSPGACGSPRPAINAAPAIAPDGTVYVLSRAHFNAAYGYLAATTADLVPKWSASLRDRLNDGCDVLLPPAGTVGGCRVGSRRGVDPATNQLPSGRLEDQSTASPVIAPDGSILLGTASRYNYARGHLFRFSSVGNFLASYDFGWDITPAIYEHDGTWSAIVKDNFYPVGTYCTVPGFCGQGIPRYSLTSLAPDLRAEWTYTNTNMRQCEVLPDGARKCQTSPEPFEWCVNMVAVDRDGSVYANSEDGNVYSINRKGRLTGHIFLKTALGAAYTPLAIGGDGRVYTQNDGTLFVIGAPTRCAAPSLVQSVPPCEPARPLR